MAINKKLIHFLSLADFETRLANSEILDTSIVFIKDAKKIWTHGNYYDGSTVDLTDIENSILNILDNKVDKVSGKGLSTNDYTTEEKNKLAGAYTKPSGGIPKTDLESTVQTSLGKADTALQNIPSEYITEEELATKNYATKDDIQKIPIISHGTGDTTFELTPNALHTWGTVSSLTLTLAAATDSTVANYYMAEFVSGSTATTLSLPSTISWQNDINIEANKTYLISILNNCGVIGGF